jgi:hypothetical protein
MQTTVPCICFPHCGQFFFDLLTVERSESLSASPFCIKASEQDRDFSLLSANQSATSWSIGSFDLRRWELRTECLSDNVKVRPHRLHRACSLTSGYSRFDACPQLHLNRNRKASTFPRFREFSPPEQRNGAV